MNMKSGEKCKRGGNIRSKRDRKATRILMSDITKKIATSKRSQVTIFIIIAIVIVAAAVGYFLLRNKINPSVQIKQLQEPYNYFISCIENEIKIVSEIAETQAGYVTLPDFEPGSDYMPFSSQLDFNGIAVPYWYYVSGNGIIKEQVPSKSEIETQIEDYVSENIKNCDFSSFEAKGYSIQLSDMESAVKINEYSVDARVKGSIVIKFGNITESAREHSVEVETRLGRFYDVAKKIYNKQKEGMILENYSIDILNLYAPVSDTEITCSPKIWQPQKVIEELHDAIEANTQSLKVRGKYYKPESAKEFENYFVIDTGDELKAGESVNFLYSKEFPSRIEIWPVKNGLMMVEPVGLQEGLGAMGFCYVSYNFVYDVVYPVLVQVYDNEEMFQFPVAVVILKNVPREPLPGETISEEAQEICDKANTLIDVYTYDTTLAPVEADIKFKCLNSVCRIGKTELVNGGKEAKLSEKFPQCVNGVVIANAEGYAEKRKFISTNEEATADIVLDKLYNLDLEVFVGNSALGKDEMAVIYFEADTTKSVSYPEQTEVELSEAYYNITAYVFRLSTITLPSTTTRQCIKVPRSGIAGIFGMTREECYDLTLPSQTLTNVLYAGGKTSYYMTPTELQDASKIEIHAESIGMPASVEDLQKTYEIFETKKINVVLK